MTIRLELVKAVVPGKNWRGNDKFIAYTKNNGYTRGWTPDKNLEQWQALVEFIHNTVNDNGGLAHWFFCANGCIRMHEAIINKDTAALEGIAMEMME